MKRDRGEPEEFEACTYTYTAEVSVNPETIWQEDPPMPDRGPETFVHMSDRRLGTECGIAGPDAAWLLVTADPDYVTCPGCALGDLDHRGQADQLRRELEERAANRMTWPQTWALIFAAVFASAFAESVWWWYSGWQ